MRKKWWILAVAGALLAAGTGCATVPGAPPGQAVQDVASYETIALLPVGEGRDMIGYSPDVPGVINEGPRAFWVLDDGTIRLLDTVKRRVVDFRGTGFVREFPLPAGLEGRDLVVSADGRTYVLGTCGATVVVALDTRGQLVGTWQVPPELAGLVVCLQPQVAGAPLLVCADVGEAQLDSLAHGGDWLKWFSHLGLDLAYGPGKGNARLKAGRHVIELQGRRDLREVTVWGVDDQRNIYLTYCDMAEASLVAGDILVCKYSARGERLGVANVATQGLWSWPCRWVFVARDGSVYLLRPRGAGVAIERLTLGRRYESIIDRVEEQWRLEKAAFK